jgi:predicted nuclease of predicted toxin-antitoxin system
MFDTHFPDEQRVREQEVHDNRVIKLCSKKRWLIVTRDKDMRIDHVETIKKCPHTMIVATANNNKGDLASWVNGLLLALPELLDRYQSFKRPWYSQFDRSGKVGVCKTIDCAAYTRRKRRVAKK